MNYDQDYINHQYYKYRGDLVGDNPLWLQKAVQQKSPRLSLELAHSTLLVYDDLDKKLLALTRLN